jgi:apolipoprotein N-acyltransferase
MARTFAILVCAVALAAGAFYFSTGLGESWPLAWLAPIPILIAAYRSSGKAAFMAATIAYFTGELSLLPLLRLVLPPLVIAGALVGPAVAFGAAVLAARYVTHRVPPHAGVFAFPCAWTAYEFFTSRVSPHGTFGSLAYSQTDFLPVLQIASITGIWGIAFLICLFAAAVSAAWHFRKLTLVAPAASVLVLVLAFGILRLREAPHGSDVRVGLAATDHGIQDVFATEDPVRALAVAREYAARVQALAAQRAQVVILPEKFVGVTTEDRAAVQQVLAGAARDGNVMVVAGLNHLAPLRTVAAVFSPDGQLTTEYDKHHMLPGPETGYAVGETPGLFHAAGVQWGLAICKDMDFPRWSRVYGQRGVQVLAVPAWDFVRDGRLHSRMAVLRGVENGFSIARAAQQGMLTLSDAYGRIIAETRTSGTPEATVVHNLEAGPGATFYTAYGDWFAWVTVFAFAVLVSWAAVWARVLIYEQPGGTARLDPRFTQRPITSRR